MSTSDSNKASYHDLLEPFPHPADSQSLARLYSLAYGAPTSQAREIVREIYQALNDHIDAYWGPPDIWHNFAILAGRLHMYDEEYRFYISGLHAWRDDVDLLCDLLNEYTGLGNQHYNPGLARKTWQILENLPREITSPYWRFWVFSAIYFARIEGNPAHGVEILDEGLLSVRRDTIQNILRNYRVLLVDQAPGTRIKHLGELDAAQQDLIGRLEQRYTLGIRLGVENGYVLATELARLYQERAGTRAVASALIDARAAQTAVNEDLGKALTYLKLAEALYTGDSRHPIDDIYRIRIHILMAQGHYGEALRILRSMPEVVESDPSMKIMLRLATLSTGGKLDEDKEGQNSSLAADSSQSTAALDHIFDGTGQTLAALVQQNALVRATFYRALQLLQNESSGD